MRINNQENTKKIVGAPEFWCPGTRTLVPFQVDNCFFYCNLKNGHQEYQFVFFPKCIDVFLTFPVFFQNIASTNVSTPSRNPPKKWGGTRALVPGHQNPGAPYVPDWLGSIEWSAGRKLLPNKMLNNAKFIKSIFIHHLESNEGIKQISLHAVSDHQML